ncbi:DNA methylase N-4/N-6 [Beggiatoa sp. PS]|nr:DNA methylase N-4/N-6 [Beggiatoa sp. PS]
MEILMQNRRDGSKMNNHIEIKPGDAIDLFQDIKDDSIDLIIADPPYNLGKDYGNNHDLKAFDDYINFSKKWLSQAKRVLKPTGTIYVFMGVKFISYLYNIMDRELNLCFNSWICWHYTQGMGKTMGFSPRHDDILMFNKTKTYVFNLDAIRIPQKYYRAKNNMRGANPGDVWEFSHIHYCHENRQNHPTKNQKD